MKYDFELIQYQDGLPIKAFIQSISRYKLHWHAEMEIILVLKGSLQVHVEKNDYIIKERQVIVINSNEIHSTNALSEDNLLLVLQIKGTFWDSFSPGIKNVRFGQTSLCGDAETNEALMAHLSKIVRELNKKAEGYQFEVMSSLNLLMAYLIKNCGCEYTNEQSLPAQESKLKRLNRIMEYINANYAENITLNDIAKAEYVNFYYLSHFFRNHAGITFREYLNRVRLEKAVEAISDMDRSISEIALSCGFSSVKMLVKHFKEKYRCTPNEYRKRLPESGGDVIRPIQPDGFGESSSAYLSFSSVDAADKILPYLKAGEGEPSGKPARKTEAIAIDACRRGRELNKYWKRLTTFGRAAEGLRADWQEQLKELQSELGFEYIRFHGIFNDEMMILNSTAKGETVYNWSYVDRLLDFFMEIKIRPFLELSFMPSCLARSDKTVFWWKGNISPPVSLEAWTDMVRAFIRHCLGRYGLREVEAWYFEVWNEPDLEGLCWSGSRQEYFEFYKATALAVRSVSDRLRIGGPAVTHGSLEEGSWLDDFVQFCNRGCVPLDFISFHIYGEKMPPDVYGELSKTNREAGNGNQAVSLRLKHGFRGSGFTGEITGRALSKNYRSGGKKPELHVTEWNLSSNKTSFARDTAFMAPFIVKSVLECGDTVDSLGFWTFTDIMEEHKAGTSPFHGGLGLINANGIKKPAYYAYYLLSRLGSEVVQRGEQYIVTKSGENVQALFYNFAYFDRFALNGDFSAMTATSRYSVFEEKPDKKLEVVLEGLNGRYKATRYELNREHGSAYDEWLKMGAPDFPTEEEAEYLKKTALPRMTIRRVHIEGAFSLTVDLPVHGCVLLVLEREY